MARRILVLVFLDVQTREKDDTYPADAEYDHLDLEKRSVWLFELAPSFSSLLTLYFPTLISDWSIATGPVAM